MRSMNLVLLFCAFLNLMASVAFANVVLIGNNVTLSFDDIQANFGQFFFIYLWLFYLYAVWLLRKREKANNMDLIFYLFLIILIPKTLLAE